MFWSTLLLLMLAVSEVLMQQCNYEDNKRFDCLPGPNKSPESSCKERGCCWKPANNDYKHTSNVGIGVPFCFYPPEYVGYNMTFIKDTDYGVTGLVDRSTKSGWPNDIKQLSFDVWYETKNRLHIKISDARAKRYEVPVEVPQPPSHKSPDTDYKIELRSNPFAFVVTRKSTGAILFDTSVAPLIFADQFIQISTKLDSTYVYGLGEHKITLLHNATSWQRMSMWARDQSPKQNSNLYGTHPFYVNIEKASSNVHGVFFLNSNAMEFDLTPLPGLTFRTIGGVLDIYIFTGPSADSVVQQFAEVVGLPQLPPYWSLGFHLCRYNYNSADRLKFIIQRNREIGIPYEVQWSDIDYMRAHLDWTYDTKAYQGLDDIVKDLHDHDQKYIVIVDPGISNEQPRGQYKPYDEGLARDVFIKDLNGKPLVGQVWPGLTVFPDFTHPKAADWWYEMAQEFHQKISFDGLWIDMNEPANFVDGSVTGCNGSLDRPPYVPKLEGDGRLEVKTVCASAQQFYSSHYNLHNLYGLTEANATNRALRKILNKRSIVISRSSYPSLGRHGGHWTGDVFSTWEDLYYSIPAILEFQMYVVPLVGADVCGFDWNTTEELCVRWMQLGSFYPFMRNHNDDVSMDQDPAAFGPDAQYAMKMALFIRYTLLPYFYTQFFLSHTTGRPVIRPLFFLFPDDVDTYGIDEQFMWGNAILISPALKQGQTEVNAYFPRGLWYDGYTGMLVASGSKGQRVKLDAPLSKINFHMRGGEILAVQSPDVTTVASRKNGFGLYIAFNETKQASGLLYWDDGETLEVVERGLYVLVSFKASMNNITSSLVRVGYKPTEPFQLELINCMGVDKAPNTLTINGKSVDFIYLDDVKMLTVGGLTDISLLQPISVQWS